MVWLSRQKIEARFIENVLKYSSRPHGGEQCTKAITISWTMLTHSWMFFCLLCKEISGYIKNHPQLCGSNESDSALLVGANVSLGRFQLEVAKEKSPFYVRSTQVLAV